MENVSFTFEDAQRISNAVLASERSKYAVKPVDLTSQADELIIINVTATTKYADGTQNGNLSYWDETNHVFAQYDPTQTVRVRAANTADTLPTGYVFARFQGVTSRSGVVGPLYIAVTVRPSGGSASITVVTDVVCTPEGLEVTSATLSGADSFVANDFLSLTDVAAGTYLGNANRVVKVNGSATGLTFGAITDSTAATFIGLGDAPAVYGTANTYKPACVAASNAGLEFRSNLVTTTNSLTGGGNPCSPAYVALSLVNDTDYPGNYYAYSTNSAGVKGWYVPAATPTGLTVGGNVVVSARKAAVADVTAHTISSAGLATTASSTQTAINDLTTQLNLLLARIRSHGLIS